MRRKLLPGISKNLACYGLSLTLSKREGMFGRDF
jgi:hypothetical protein